MTVDQALILRTFDIILSFIGLVVAAPLFLVISVFIKLDSKGPVFYAAQRVGKGMKLFPMYKFRTMMESSVRIDQSVCPQHDPRVTTVGRILRRTKVNELPQLLNILRGDMSFVGPRPEAPDLAKMYPEEAKRIFSVKPGLVGPVVISSLNGQANGRNEEELYPKGVDPKKYYIEHILPEKVKIDLYYLSRQTIGTYFKIIFGAAKETIFGAFSTRQSDHSKRQIYLFAGDFALSQLSYALAYWLYFLTTGKGTSIKSFLGGLLLVVVVRSIFHYGLGLYSLVMELVTARDVYRVSRAVFLGGVLLLSINAFYGVHFYPPLLGLYDFSLLGSMLMGIRLLLMFRFRDKGEKIAPDRRPRILIFGANKLGLRALSTLGGSKTSPYEIVGFIDDAEEKYGRKISGVKVLGNRYHIQALSVLHNIQEVVLALDEKSRDQIDEIVALCAQAGIRSRIFCPDINGKTTSRLWYPVRPVQLSDMLPQVQVPLDEPVLRSLLPDRTVLMVGSGGQLGSAVCRSLFLRGCRKVVIVERYESYLREILAELRRDLPGFQIVPVILDTEDMDALNKVFALHRPQIVIHAGMRKFIPVGKTADNDEVVRSNYVRTFELAKVASRHNCEYFIMISSIKAVSRGNFVSESLRVAEITLSRYFSQTPTRLIVTRVGNIIENRGGIVSWLNNQILEQSLILLPAETAKAFHLSRRTASRSILQALATG
ncbi:MAG: sugar transferase, partial [Deltaproteobacteria bacterium]|nr:sugar transferase [Deltaproteobacteria bacterium]